MQKKSHLQDSYSIIRTFFFSGMFMYLFTLTAFFFKFYNNHKEFRLLDNYNIMENTDAKKIIRHFS